jgi:hypothetical protein
MRDATGRDSVRVITGGTETIYSTGETDSGFSHIEGITLDAGDEEDEVAGGLSGMSVDRIFEICDRANEGQAASVSGMFYNRVSGESRCQRYNMEAED